jgi:multidrug efflux system membrane fusion protein
MNSTARTRLLATAALVLLTPFAGCRRGGGPPRGMPPVSVRTAVARQADMPIVIPTFGTTEDRINVNVVPQVSGILRECLIRDGAVVTNGQPLFRIDDSDYALRVRQTEGLVKADEANVALARGTLARTRPLADKEMVSEESLDALRARLDAAEAQLQVNRASLDQARLGLERCTVTAAVAGVCSKVYVDEGNLVAAGVTRLTNIRAYDPLRVSFSVPETHLPVLREAMGAGKARIDVLPRGETNRYDGSLEFLDNAVNPATGTILLRGLVPNPSQRLWANQFVEVRVFAGAVAGAVLVPESAVLFGKQGAYLFAVGNENKAEMRIVRPGARFDNELQIESGVAAGETVVVAGQFLLFPGATAMDLSKMPPPQPPGAGTTPGPRNHRMGHP